MDIGEILEQNSMHSAYVQIDSDSTDYNMFHVFSTYELLPETPIIIICVCLHGSRYIMYIMYIGHQHTTAVYIDVTGYPSNKFLTQSVFHGALASTVL